MMLTAPWAWHMLTMTKTHTKTKCLNNPTCAIVLKDRRYKVNDFKSDTLTGQLINFLSVNQTRPDNMGSIRVLHTFLCLVNANFPFQDVV